METSLDEKRMSSNSAMSDGAMSDGAVIPLGGDEIVRKSEDVGESNRKKGSNFASIAYRDQKDENHIEAIRYYTRAISLVPDDHRYYVNRCASYEAIGDFTRALADAEKSIELDDSKPKGHFRKGHVLRQMKRFKEAEKCFKQVLKLLPGCEDSIEQLKSMRLQLSLQTGLDEGLSRWTSEQCSSISKCSSISETIDSLVEVERKTPDKHQQQRYSDRVIHSKTRSIERYQKDPNQSARFPSKVADNTMSKQWLSSKNVSKQRSSPKNVSKQWSSRKNESNGRDRFERFVNFDVNQVKFEKKLGREDGPTNLFGYHGMYIGHIDPDAKIDDIKNVFSKYGTIESIRFLAEKYCAFISYNNPESPREAIQDLHDRKLSRLCVAGKTLRMHFTPSKDQHRLDSLSEDRNSPSKDRDSPSKDRNSPSDDRNPKSKDRDSPSDDRDSKNKNNECYNWRTTGCTDDRCQLRHLKLCRGIDFQPWMNQRNQSDHRRQIKTPFSSSSPNKYH